jgi:hypothetical protein
VHEDLLRTPTLHDAGEVHLFRIVGDERAELEDHPAIVTIRAPHEYRFRHVRLQRLKNLADLRVIELLPEGAKLFVIIRVARSCRTSAVIDDLVIRY